MISLITAMSKNRVIGNKGRMPWNLPADLTYFQKMTMGHPVIMGRKTFEAIGRPLPGRENVIITGNQNYQPKDCLILHSIDGAISFCNHKNGFVIGGSQIYQQFLPLADRLYITFINKIFRGDSFFPKIDPQLWQLTSQTQGEQNQQNPYDYSFLVYEKRLE
ncbi:MAG TPA: dihydrofolate reductase [Firmicutes bacterium]|jgi:dihydrofolate reductase|nr:dihydrofolate reductase [Bacillota bacterium]